MKRPPLLLSTFFAALLALTLAGNTSAAQISFTSVSGNWRDPVDTLPGSQTGDPVFTNGVPTSSIHWGVGSPQSGYDFTRTMPGSLMLPPAPTPFFGLGTFTHRNFPVNDPSLTSVKLDVVLVLNVDGIATGPLTFTFTFTHVETPNNQTPCPFTTPPGEDCTDRVTLASSPQPTTFNVGGVDYTLAMSFVDDNNNPLAAFLTREGLANTANLIGQFTVAPPAACGDGQCNATESCSICSTDCGVCPPPPGLPHRRLIISPRQAQMHPGDTLPFTAVSQDVATGVQVSTIPIWAATGSGNISPTGLLTALSTSRSITITASLPGHDSDSVQVMILAPGAATDISNAYPYPVPYKSTMGGTVTFKNLAPDTKIRILTSHGREVRALYSVLGENVDWNIKNMNNERIASGVYLYVLENPTTQQTKKGKLVIIQ